jgi:hypothetical protein
MKFGQFEHVDIVRDSSGKIAIDCVGTARMPIERAQAWLVTQTLRLQREAQAGAKTFAVDAHLRFVIEELRQAESIADDLYMQANDVDLNEKIYSVWKYDDERDPLALNPNKDGGR